MNAPDKALFASAMAEATRLTRQGRLGDATRLIQQTLGGRLPTTARTSDAPSEALPPVVLDGCVTELDDRPLVATPTPPRSHAPTEQGPARPNPASSSRFEQRGYSSPQGKRHYKLFVPAGLAASAASPLVVMLHGCTQNPDDFAAGTRMNELAQARGFRVLYPAQAARSNAQRCWNWFNPADQARGRGEPALLAGMVRQVMETQAVDAGRVYVAGLSAGGAMAAILGQEYPDLFAAVGVHSGLPPGAAHDVASAFTSMKQGPQAGARRLDRRPVIVFHGDGDTTVHPRNGEQLLPGMPAPERETGRSPGGQAYVRQVQRDTQGLSVVEHWLVQGLGHAWSGGSAAGSYTEPRGPDASAEMLRFFWQHRR